MHDTSGHHHIFSQQLTPYLEQVLNGIKKEQLKPGGLPISVDLMEQIHSVLSHKMQDYNNVLLWAAYFGLLRCSKFTVPSINDYNPTVHLSLQDIVIDSHKAPTLIRLNIKQSKTDPFR